MKQGGKADEKMARVVAVVPQYLPHSFQPGRQLHTAGDHQGAEGGWVRMTKPRSGLWCVIETTDGWWGMDRINA